MRGKSENSISRPATVIALLILALAGASFVKMKNAGGMPTSTSLPKEEARVYVLCYHSFYGKGKAPTDFSMDELSGHIKSFVVEGFRYVSFSDIAEKRISGLKNILVTIDDGDVTGYTAYREVLRPLGIRPVFAVYPGVIGKGGRFMDWGQLRELSSEGCCIVTHGYYHLYVDAGLYKKNRKDFFKEIYGSKKSVEANLGIKVTGFAYPYGRRSGVTMKALKLTGYELAFTLGGAYLSVPPEGKRIGYEIPRYMLTRDNWGSVRAVVLRMSRGD